MCMSSPATESTPKTCWLSWNKKDWTRILLSAIFTLNKMRMEDTMDIARDIHSLNEFKRNSKDMIDRMTKEHTPQVLTVNGKPAVVMVDPEVYQSVKDHIETVTSILIGLEQVRNGEGDDVDTVFKRLNEEV